MPPTEYDRARAQCDEWEAAASSELSSGIDVVESTPGAAGAALPHLRAAQGYSRAAHGLRDTLAELHQAGADRKAG